MVAVLVLHGKADLDWATDLSNDLKEHSPVRFQVGTSPPQVAFGPSVVRVALWSEDSAAEDIAGAMSALISSGTRHSILVRRSGCEPPAGLDATQLGDNVVITEPRQATELLRSAIPRVAGSVETIAKQERVRIETIKDARLRMLDTLALVVVIALLGALAWIFDWGGLRSMILGQSAG
jgi:hypothetical protein